MGVDTDTPAGRLVVATLGAVAKFEQALMLERQRESLSKVNGEGRYRGAQADCASEASPMYCGSAKPA